MVKCKFLTPKNISDILKISYDKALDFIKYSGVAYIKIGNMYRVDEDDFNKFIKMEKAKIK